MRKIVVGDILTDKVEKCVYKGFGLCKIEKACIFIPNTLPGEELEFEITGKKIGYGFLRFVLWAVLISVFGELRIFLTLI